IPGPSARVQALQNCTAGPRRANRSWRTPRVGKGPQIAGSAGKAQGPGRFSGRGPGFGSRSGGPGGRATDAPALRPHLRGGPVDVLRELRPAVEDVALHLGHPERPLEVILRELGVERLAREDVHTHVLLV